MSLSKLETSDEFIRATRRFITFYSNIDELEGTNLVQALMDDIDHALHTYLVRHPEMFKRHQSRKYETRTRRCILHKFRQIYIVYYYDKSNDTVILLDLAHYKQKN